MENKRVLSIGAHPDDADVSAAGLLQKLRDAGWEVRLLSLTDGGAGTLGQGVTREQVSAMRREEARRSGELFGGRYDVLNTPDGMLEPTMAAREELIRYIRTYRPGLILTNRLWDYHPDHRAASTLVQDASYMLIVPFVCPDVPQLDYMPVILYWQDDFTRPYPFASDILVPLAKRRIDRKTEIAACHESQYFDWLCYPDHMEVRDWPREKQFEYLRARYDRSAEAHRAEKDAEVRAKYGDLADSIPRLESYEISEYGAEPSDELIKLMESIDK